MAVWGSSHQNNSTKIKRAVRLFAGDSEPWFAPGKAENLRKTGANLNPADGGVGLIASE
jgi:hypothetical protein